MSSSPESVKCVRDIRDIPPQAYRMPDDGRQWKHLCIQRQRLAWLLATYADGDGSNIHAAATTFANALGVSRRTIFRWLDDLRKLGFENDGKLTGFKGTRRRTLNVAAIQASSPVVPCSPVMPSMHPVVPSTPPTSAIYALPRVPSTHVSLPESREDGTQPSFRPTKQQTDQQTGPEVCRLFFEHNQMPMNLRKQDLEQFMAAIKQHGKAAVMLAWKAFVETGNYNDKTVYPAYMFFKDGNSDNYIAAAKLKMQSDSWQRENNPAYAEQVEAGTRRQAAAEWQRITTPVKNIGKDGREVIEGDLLSLLPETEKT